MINHYTFTQAHIFNPVSISFSYLLTYVPMFLCVHTMTHHIRANKHSHTYRLSITFHKHQYQSYNPIILLSLTITFPFPYPYSNISVLPRTHASYQFSSFIVFIYLLHALHTVHIHSIYFAYIYIYRIHLS